MISRVPNENALLLRYLLAMLHGIQGNAQENQMTSFNLSVCIAPSMLWPPGAPCSTEAEGEGTKKVRAEPGPCTVEQLSFQGQKLPKHTNDKFYMRGKYFISNINHSDPHLNRY